MSPATRGGNQSPLSQAFLQRYESHWQEGERSENTSQALGMHFDSRSANGEVVVGLNLGESGGHIFFSRSGPGKGQAFPLSVANNLEDRGEGILVKLPRRSLYLFYGFARFHLRHGVPWQNPAAQGSYQRVTVTFRSVPEPRLKKYLEEKEIFRMDHYLAKTLVLNLLTLRFANRELGHLFHCHHVANVRITFKEAIGVQGRAGYFDGYGIIRDIMQNHLMQVLTLVAMEAPATLEAEDVRDEKVKVLKQIRPISPRDCVIGQYEGYQDDPDIQKINLKQGYASRCPTFAVAVLYLDNERWSGVPFIMKAGKGLEVHQTIVRIQFKKAPPSSLFGEQPQNELVIRIQPNEAIYYK
ncbi:gsdA, partial [Symbiodinium pilosum]